MAGKGRRAFGSVRQLASGRWQARYLDAAGVRDTAPRTFPTKVEATRYLHRAGEVTPTTIAKAYRLLRRILNVAVEAGYLPRKS